VTIREPDTHINLRVFSSGAAEAEGMLRLRDRLRDDDAARDRYVRINRELAQRTWRHVQDYATPRPPWNKQILGQAESAPTPSQ
jgi:GrpB-like predicted nucleotidyltransferase (UPF0157 family)